MGGLARICRQYGGMNVNDFEWVYDYIKDKPRLRSEMTDDEFNASEKKHWTDLKNLYEQQKIIDQI